MSSHCSWQTPLESTLFPCHGLSGKRSRRRKIMSAAVLEEVSAISKLPCPGTSTETDMRQRVLCAVQWHEFSAVWNNNEQYTGLISTVYQRLALAQHEIWLLIRLARVSCQGEWYRRMQLRCRSVLKGSYGDTNWAAPPKEPTQSRPTRSRKRTTTTLQNSFESKLCPNSNTGCSNVLYTILYNIIQYYYYISIYIYIF